MFNVESEPGHGSRFYFRLPLGIRKAIGILLCILLPACLFSSCTGGTGQATGPVTGDSIATVTDPDYETLLNEASDYANAAYFANVDGYYEDALVYADSAIMILNRPYEKYAAIRRNI